MTQKCPVHYDSIGELVEGVSCKDRYCILKVICSSMYKLNPRQLIQMKCVEILKWEANKSQREEMSFADALQLWHDTGYAIAFAAVYDTDDDAELSIIDIYQKTKEKVLQS